MQFLNYKSLNLIFKVFCLSAAIGMVVYWVVKFQRNEDVSVIEFKSVVSMDDIILPDFTLCIRKPFINDALQNVSTDLSEENYLKYLRGEIPDNVDRRYKNINFDDVTINLENFLRFLNISWRPEYTNGSSSSCVDMKNCPFATLENNFNAFPSDKVLYKCFTIGLNKRYAPFIHSISLHFESRLEDLLNTRTGVYLAYHYPQQMIISPGGEMIWNTPNKTTGTTLIHVTNVEVIKRRNKQNEPCILDWMHMDDLALSKHIEDVGCRAPYMKQYNNISICETQNQMHDSIYDWNIALKHYMTPCQGISHMAHVAYRLPFEIDPERSQPSTSCVTLGIEYPNNIKLITQSRMVDIQALIGYIGGYVGLFLGMVKAIINWSLL